MVTLDTSRPSPVRPAARGPHGAYRTTDAHRMIRALAASGRYEAYVAYTRPGECRFAATVAGGVGGTVELTARSVRWSVGGRGGAVGAGDAPLAALGRVLGAHLADAGHDGYGHVDFEIGRLLHGAGRPVPDERPLARFLVPDVEVRWDATGLTVRSADPVEAEVARQVCATCPPGAPRPDGTVDLHDPAAGAAYRRLVADALERIDRGPLRKVILSRRVEVPFAVDLPATYLAGMRRNTPARSFLLDLGGLRATGFSPEIVTSVSPGGEVQTQPLAGTRPLRGDRGRDLAWRDELSWDVKECYEHVISVRLAVEELEQVCAPGVAVRDLLAIKERGTVQHLASRVTGPLRAGLGAWDALAALFPAVTASGIPKREAVQAISDMEDGDRGLYAGAVCLAGTDGSLDAALVLRSIFQRGDRTWLQAGAGIVEGSRPDAELDETTNKLRSAAGSLVRRLPGRAGAGGGRLELAGG